MPFCRNELADHRPGLRMKGAEGVGDKMVTYPTRPRTGFRVVSGFDPGCFIKKAGARSGARRMPHRRDQTEIKGNWARLKLSYQEVSRAAIFVARDWGLSFSTGYPASENRVATVSFSKVCPLDMAPELRHVTA